jgi:hypothetical protein
VASTLFALGVYYPTPSNYFDGYLTETIFVDGQALTPSSFGETDTITGVWKPKRYTGTYGTNGFYLPFTDVATTSGSNAGLGKDFSGNGNYWTTNNISVTTGTTYDSMTDVPTLTDASTANYCVWNPITPGYYSRALPTVTNGNLQVTGSSVVGTGTMQWGTTGKFYFEQTVATFGTSTAGFGICNLALCLNSEATIEWNTLAPSYTSGQIQNGGSVVGSFSGTYASGDVLGFAIDVDNGTMAIYKNNTLQTTVTAAQLVSSGGTYTDFKNMTPFFRSAAGYASTLNCGQRPFAYTPPTGYKALNTYNLPDSTIVAGNKVMDATTYTGTGTTQTVTNAGGFKPDMIWFKSRSSAYNHAIQDSVRGTNNIIFPNLTNAEGNYPNSLNSFNSNGFTLGSDGSVVVSNNSGSTYVGWQWQAGQGSTSSNTSGSITSTVSVNASAGFSIVTYTGNGGNNQTVGHGLGVAPKFIIIKNRSATQGWATWHGSLPTKAGSLNTTDDFQTGSYAAYGFNEPASSGTYPTSSVFYISASGRTYNSDITNGNGNTFVAYCWAEIQGFSKAFSYTGNGSSDGTFIYLGFKPKFIIYKRTDSTGSWFMVDTTRNTYNVANYWLQANTSEAEQTDGAIDFLSNGYKIRGTGTGTNASGGTYVGMAFSENPFKNSLAR